MKKLNYLNRSQLQALHRLGSDRNASRVLQNMSGYVSSFRDGENVYYLNKEGRERVNCRKILKKTLQARHYIMRNYLYIAYGQPETWRNEMRLEVKGVTSVVCDALFRLDNRYYIVEVDHTQKMAKNRQKVARYRRLIEAGAFDTPPGFVWMTTTEYRRKQLEKLNEGLGCRVFTVQDFQ
ncbi:replication-relaxation family protein [Salibacterium aidingense]|uniref:replication-relaxation family protein n=1 Tax=Salibacterium aidingense TaxID=384933 RepID=UPI003BF5A94E